MRLLTTWFNGPDDLTWLRGWQDTLIPQAYADGYAHQLIVYDGAEDRDDPDRLRARLRTALPALGAVPRRHARSWREIFRGDGPLYVTMFSEFQTYPCEDNQWQGSEAYYQALKDQYVAAMAIFRAANPRALVGLGWGGWQGRWDDPSVGGGRSLIPHFADVLERSDYQAFQAMQVDSNLDDIRTMTRLLAPYGRVMVAHYLPDDESADVWDADVAQIFTDAFMTEIVGAGLFAFSFMDPLLLDADPARLRTAVDAVGRYAADWLVPPSLASPAPSLATACPEGVPTGGFVDIGGTVHRTAIDCMRWWGITTGTADGRFEPNLAVTRAQLATFLHRVLVRTPVPTDDVPRIGFADVPAGHAHREAIETLAGLGVIRGVAPGRFAPSAPVTRGQLAVPRHPYARRGHRCRGRSVGALVHGRRGHHARAGHPPPRHAGCRGRLSRRKLPAGRADHPRADGGDRDALGRRSGGERGHRGPGPLTPRSRASTSGPTSRGASSSAASSRRVIVAVSPRVRPTGTSDSTAPACAWTRSAAYPAALPRVTM